MQLKLGAYIRVSTEEQASAIDGSLDNQKYRLKAFVDLKNTQVKSWGNIVEYYVDDGFSAKDTRRPAYQRMMSDIKRKKIDLILVTDLSRLSRNIYDFCSLMDELEKNEAQFLSIKEQFDSTTPAGKMMIYNMINLAQFEREQVSERVSLGAHARAMRGLLNGSRSILGYDKSENAPGSYIINATEADQVRKIFELFLSSGSCAKTIKELNVIGIAPKNHGKYGKIKLNKTWSCQTLTNLLSSAAYIGMREINKGNKAKDQAKLKPHQQYKVVKASWPAIIENQIFESAQNLLVEAKKQERVRLEGAEDRFYILSGILRCGECGSPLVGQAAHGQKSTHRYYGHTQAYKGTSCEYHRIPAEDIEKEVLDYVYAAIEDAGYLQHIKVKISNNRNVRSIQLAREKKSIRDEISNLQLKVDNLLLMQSKSSSNSALQLAMKTFEALSSEKDSLEKKLKSLDSSEVETEQIENSVDVISANLHEFQKGFKKAKGSVKKRLLKKVLRQVVLAPEGFHVFMPMADRLDIPNHKMKLIRFEGPKDQKKSPVAIFSKASGDDSNLQVLSSDINKIGDRGTT